MVMIKGNVDSTYELRKAEENHVHVRTINKVHVPSEERYKDVVDVRKFGPKQHSINLKEGFYNQYSKTEVLHHPDKSKDETIIETGTTKKKTTDNLKVKYSKLFNEEAPNNISKKQLTKAVSEKEAEMIKEVEKDYTGIVGKEGKEGADIYEMIDAIDKKLNS